MRLLKKYGGMEFNENGHCRIDKDKMNFMTKGGDRGFKALACRPNYNPHEPDEDDYDNMIINLDLLGLIYTYYMENPDPKIRIITKPEDIDPNKEWNSWLPNKDGRTRRAPRTANTAANRTAPTAANRAASAAARKPPKAPPKKTKATGRAQLPTRNTRHVGNGSPPTRSSTRRGGDGSGGRSSKR
jgi:hypothetical protein